MFGFFLIKHWILLLVLISGTQALTISLGPHEHRCFYAFLYDIGKKVKFYFAVEAGGSFDVDYRVTDGNNRVVFNGVKEKQGEMEFMVKRGGEYSFCFSNDMSTVTEKILQFQLTIEDEIELLFGSPHSTEEPTGTLDRSLYQISKAFASIRQSQRYLRLRESRNLSTVRSTETRIFWFSLTESILIIVVSALQVFILKTFFTSKTTLRV